MKTIVSLLNNSGFHSVNDLIRYFQNKQPKKYFYRPIGIEVEITNRCNLKCLGCNIMMDELNKPNDLLSAQEFNNILTECNKLGMFGYSITGGEPFLKFNTILEIIKFNHGLDLYKLNTNGSFFRSIKITQQYLSELKSVGLGKRNKYIKPVIVISLGQQNFAGVPIQNTVNLTSQIYNFFSGDEISCCLNLTDANPLLVKKIYADFLKSYYKITGKKFSENRFEVRFFSLNTVETLRRLSLISGPERPMIERIRDFKTEYLSQGCFNINVQNTIYQKRAETLIPRCVLRPNGDLYACQGFSRVHLLGNLIDTPLNLILDQANRDLTLRTVFTNNLTGLYRLALKKNRRKTYETLVGKQYSPCDICQMLTGFIKFKN